MLSTMFNTYISFKVVQNVQIGIWTLAVENNHTISHKSSSFFLIFFFFTKDINELWPNQRNILFCKGRGLFKKTASVYSRWHKLL